MDKRIVSSLLFFIFSFVAWGQGVPQLLTQNIPMGDSVHLATDIYIPSSEGTFPTILYLLPENRRAQERQQFCQFLVSRGFAVVIQNPRGKFGSEGNYQPFIDELKDFRQTLEWTLEQDWCNGKIGVFGSEVSSYNAQLLASTQHPAIKAIVNHSGLTKLDAFFFSGGVFRLNTIMPWLNALYLDKKFSPDQWEAIFKEVPLSENMEWETYLLYRMAQQSVPGHKIKTPVLHITGWNDLTYRQTFFLHQDIKHFNASVPQHLLVGPWDHPDRFGSSTVVGDLDFGREGIFSSSAFQRRVADWFDHYVNEIPIPMLGQHEFFVMGLNQWVDIPAYPVPEREVLRFYLQENGELGPEAPEQEQSYSFVFDPENPVPSYGGVNSPFFPEKSGPRNQSRFLAREDIIAFESDTLSEDTYILGEMKVVLFASSDVPDTDFTAKLMIKRDSNDYRIIEDGIIRVANRNTLMSKEWLEKDNIYRMEIDLGISGIEIKAGEQLVLHVSSSNFPKYNVNHNVKENPLETSRFQKANQTIYAGGRSASYLSVTTVPKSFIQEHLRLKELQINK
jgi:predicted acyl esterase